MSRLREEADPGGLLDDVDSDVRRRAGAFFLGWLVLAASMSLAGNVGHAL